MTARAQGWLLSLGGGALLWLLALWTISMLASVARDVVTYGDIFGDERYWPPECTEECTLTGLGGIIGVWLKHVETHDRFVVRGTCASACEMAYRYARDSGKTVRVAPNALLIPHRVPGEYVSP